VRRHIALGVLLGLGGCAYYNGMYNANHLAHQAEKAQRAGRTFDAQTLWSQAEIRADSVIVRHPTSRYVDDAQLIRGKSMVARGECAQAIPALEVASLSRDSPDVAEEATALLGECKLQTGDLAGADRAFIELLDSPDSVVRTGARLQHGRALLASAQYQAALEAVDSLTGPAADAERAAAYAGLGRVAEAEPLIAQAIAEENVTIGWDSVLAGIGRVDPALASRLTSSVILLPKLPAEERDRLLTDDGRRQLAIDPDSGLARLHAAAAAQPVTDAALRAQLVIAEFQMGRAVALAELQEARGGLQTLSEIGGPSSIRALAYLRALDRVRAYADSVPAGAPEGDLATFVIAETVRDSLPAPRIAAQLFASIPAAWPASPYAPKALLALAVLLPQEADSLRSVLESSYLDSPYLALVAGDVTPAALALEDSLQAYTVKAAQARFVPGARRVVAPPGGKQPTPRNEGELR
jgi:tetratricopeptide (TPR) repeat protein